MTPDERRGHIAEFFRLIKSPDGIVEFRAPNAGRYGRDVLSGYFDNEEDFTNAVMESKAPSFYATLNEVVPSLLARAANRVKENLKTTTQDEDKQITRRRWILFDFDARRPAGISSSDTEHESALTCALSCANWLQSEFGLDPVRIDSGNGGHLLVSVDLPNDEASKELVTKVIEAIAFRYDDTNVEVDTSVFNAARITKIPGTKTGKGDSTEDRPHRFAKFLHRPNENPAVPLEILQQIAALAPEVEKPTYTQRGTSGSYDPVSFVRDFLTQHGIQAHRELPYKGGLKWQLECCPFNPDHRDGDAAVFANRDGIGFHCLHNSCTGRRWSDFREHFEPGYREEREQKERAYQERQTSRTGQQGAKPPKPEKPEEERTVVCLADVEVQPVEWLSLGYIPFGVITTIEGDPGIGKGTLTAYIVAQASRGVPMLVSELEHEPINTILLTTAEDDLSRTIVPRLLVAGANMNRVFAFQDVLTLPDDTAFIAEQIEKHEAKLVVIDPLSAYLSGKVDSFKDQDIRRALAPLKVLAEKTGAAIVIIRHLNKGKGASAMYRGGGSIGIVGASRCALLVAYHPEQEGVRVLARIKGNLSAPPPSLSFTVLENEQYKVPVIEWGGVVNLSADDLLNPLKPNATGPAPAVQQAIDALLELLASGAEYLSTDIDEALTMRGISFSSAHRARAELRKSHGLKCRPVGQGKYKKWYLSLPLDAPDAKVTNETASPDKVEIVDNLDNVENLGESQAVEDSKVVKVTNIVNDFNNTNITRNGGGTAVFDVQAGRASSQTVETSVPGSVTITTRAEIYAAGSADLNTLFYQLQARAGTACQTGLTYFRKALDNGDIPGAQEMAEAVVEQILKPSDGNQKKEEYDIE